MKLDLDCNQVLFLVIAFMLGYFFASMNRSKVYEGITAGNVKAKDGGKPWKPTAAEREVDTLTCSDSGGPHCYPKHASFRTNYNGVRINTDAYLTSCSGTDKDSPDCANMPSSPHAISCYLLHKNGHRCSSNHPQYDPDYEQEIQMWVNGRSLKTGTLACGHIGETFEDCKGKIGSNPIW
jgi:hypothetical protein